MADEGLNKQAIASALRNSIAKKREEVGSQQTPEKSPESGEAEPMHGIEDVIGVVAETIDNPLDQIELTDNPSGKIMKFLETLGRAYREKGFKLIDRVVKSWGSVRKGTKKFFKDNEWILHLMGKTKQQKGQRVFWAALVGTALACFATGLLTNDFSGQDSGDTLFEPTPIGGGDLVEEGADEPYHKDYKAAAFNQWESFKLQGFLPGGMFDPTAIDDPNTILLTGFIPGWMCVPAQAALCEKMLNTRLDVPEGQAEQVELFNKMRNSTNWNQIWLPKLLNNPNLSQEVKDFYKPENRKNLRDWYREHYFMDPESSIKNQQQVADNDFVHFLTTGKSEVNDKNIIRQGHLIASLSVNVYQAMLDEKLFDANASGETATVAKVEAALTRLDRLGTDKPEYSAADINQWLRELDFELI